MLEVLVADRVELLLDHLVGQLRARPTDPFEPSWVAVASIGMRRWLAQRLAERLGASDGRIDGISANISLPFPSELRRVVFAAHGGGADDPWNVERLAWRVLEVVTDPGADADALAPLTRRVEGVALSGRALALADLIDRYVVHRPAMLRRWADGDDVDGSGEPLDPAQRWQPVLFRAVRSRIGVPSPAEQFDQVLDQVRSGDLDLPLPASLSLFGLSTLPPDLLPLMQAVGQDRDVHALLLTPSVTVARAAAALVPADDATVLRRDLTPPPGSGNPLVRSWGTASRESAVLLGAAGVTPRYLAAEEPDPSAPPTLFDEPAPSPDLLARLQTDVRSDRVPAGDHELSIGDRSLQVHACTGMTRQVEVLRDALLHLFADQPDLTEGDVAVLCPRIEEFAPVIAAVFGPSADDGDGDGPRGPRLRYRITDRGIRSEVPLLGVAAALLDLLPGRFNASAVADFIGLPLVRSRFGLAAEDLGRLDEWIDGTNVRWGLDGSHRAEWDLPADFDANTWAAGIDQLLVGTAVRGDGTTLAVGDVAPLPVGESSTVAAARVAEAVRTLEHVRDSSQGPRSIEAWCRLVADAVDLTCSLPPAEAWQRRRLDRVLARLVDRASGPGGDPSTVELTLSDLRRLLADQLVGDPARAAFGTGALTFCSLSPLRSVPHEVVCLLGLDQDALPRGLSSGDDLLAAVAAVGDRDPRHETRQLLIESLLAARRTLVITYGAADVRSNAEVPPAVVLDELWDCVLDTSSFEDPKEVRAVVEVRHPRQAFDEANFRSDSDLGHRHDRPWGFDPLGRDGAEALARRPAVQTARPLVAEPLPGAGTDPGAIVDLLDLHAFVRKPVEQFFVRTLGVRLPDIPDEPTDELPVDLGNLENYHVGDLLLACAIRDEDDTRVTEVLRSSGSLPPGRLGDELLDKRRAEVAEYVDAAAALGVPLVADERRDVDVVWDDGLRLRGSVDCVSSPTPGPLRVRFSRPKPHHELLLAFDLFALTMSFPDTHWRAVSIHRGERQGQPPTVIDARVRGATPQERVAAASAALRGAVDLRSRGLCMPLPLFDQTSRRLAWGDMPGALVKWEDESRGENADPYNRLAFGTLTFEEMLRCRTGADAPAAVAAQMWSPVIDGLQFASDADEGGRS